MGAMANVITLPRGTLGVIAGIDIDGCDPVTAQRLHEMGFDDGVEVEVLHRGPVGGCPLAVRVGNMTVALRRDLAALIEVETCRGAAA